MNHHNLFKSRQSTWILVQSAKGMTYCGTPPPLISLIIIRRLFNLIYRYDDELWLKRDSSPWQKQHLRHDSDLPGMPEVTPAIVCDNGTGVCLIFIFSLKPIISMSNVDLASQTFPPPSFQHWLVVQWSDQPEDAPQTLPWSLVWMEGESPNYPRLSSGRKPMNIVNF